MQSFRKSFTNKTDSLKNTLLPNQNTSLKESLSKPVTSVMSRVSNAKDSLKSFSKSGTEAISSVAQTTVGFFNMKNILFAIIIIFFLAFLGFNIFKYLAEGTDIVTALLSPFTSVIALITGDTAKTTIEHTSEGTQKIVSASSNFLQVFLKFLSDIFNNSIDFVSNTSTSAIDYLQSNIKKDKITNEKGLTSEDDKKTNDKEKTNKEKNEEELDNLEEDLLNKERKIEKRLVDVPKNVKKLIVKKEENEPEPSQSDSQQHGYCYIGKVNNSRYCAKVTSKNKCMSGDIFPSMDICINPNLRS